MKVYDSAVMCDYFIILGINAGQLQAAALGRVHRHITLMSVEVPKPGAGKPPGGGCKAPPALPAATPPAS